MLNNYNFATTPSQSERQSGVNFGSLTHSRGAHKGLHLMLLKVPTRR
jgi:hypothetical protein